MKARSFIVAVAVIVAVLIAVIEAHAQTQLPVSMRIEYGQMQMSLVGVQEFHSWTAGGVVVRGKTFDELLEKLRGQKTQGAPILAALNAVGAQGWDLIAVLEKKDQDSISTTYLMKRVSR